MKVLREIASSLAMGAILIGFGYYTGYGGASAKWEEASLAELAEINEAVAAAQADAATQAEHLAASAAARAELLERLNNEALSSPFADAVCLDDAGVRELQDALRGLQGGDGSTPSE